MDLKTIKRAIDQVCEEKGIDAAKVLDAIESSIAAAYKKEYEKKGNRMQNIFSSVYCGLKNKAHDANRELNKIKPDYLIMTVVISYFIKKIIVNTFFQATDNFFFTGWGFSCLVY